MKTMKLKYSLLLLLSGAALFALSSCEKKSPSEEAAEELGDSIEDASDEVGDAIKDAADN